MHRLPRCLPTLCAALAVGFLSLSPPVWAQSHAPSRGKTHAKSHAQPQPAQPAGRLSVRMRLGDGFETWHPTRKQLGVAYAPGGSDAGPARFVVNRRTLRNYLDSIAPYARRAPKDATPVVAQPTSSDDGENAVPAKIEPGYDGAKLDVDAAVDLIQKTLQSSPATQHVVLPMKTRPAHVQVAQLQGVDSRIGYFVTRFDPGDEGRTATVRRAISIIDNTVVPPGGIFSVDKTVGPRDPAHGFFGKGHVFINGHMELQSGGGMCQVATTLFNAAMLADLKIVERHQHVRTIPYADPGRDATIYHGQKDFRIQNDTSAPLFISYKTSRSHAIVSLFGQGVPGRKVRLVSHHRRLGERHYTGSFSRIVYVPGSAPRRDPTFYSDYKWTPDLDYSR